MAEFDYDWVNYDKIPGYLADERQVRRRAGYWLYGVPLQRVEDNTQWYLCKHCHLEDSPQNAVLKVNGGGGVLNHLRARHTEQYNHVRSLLVKAPVTKKGISSILATLDDKDPVQQAIHSKAVTVFNPQGIQKDLLT